MPDLYAVLGVGRTADAGEIRAAYRRRARRHHPDLGGDEQRMMVLNKAWHILGNAERRAAYDARRSGRKSTPAKSRDGYTVLDYGRYEGWSLRESRSRGRQLSRVATAHPGRPGPQPGDQPDPRSTRGDLRRIQNDHRRHETSAFLETSLVEHDTNYRQAGAREGDRPSEHFLDRLRVASPAQRLAGR